MNSFMSYQNKIVYSLQKKHNLYNSFRPCQRKQRGGDKGILDIIDMCYLKQIYLFVNLFFDHEYYHFFQQRVHLQKVEELHRLCIYQNRQLVLYK